MEAPAPTPSPPLEAQEISEIVYIIKGSNYYPLHLDTERDILSFNLEYNHTSYKKKIALNEIKDQESAAIFFSYKPKDFIEFLKNYQK